MGKDTVTNQQWMIDEWNAGRAIFAKPEILEEQYYEGALEARKSIGKALKKEAQELCWEIEKLPASVEQTAVSVRASALCDKIVALEKVEERCGCGRTLDANDTQQMRSGMCETCLGDCQ